MRVRRSARFVKRIASCVKNSWLRPRWSMMKSMRTNLDNHFLSYMVIACLVLAAAAAVLYYQGTAAPLVDSLLRGNRPIVYGTLASINGSLLGFSIAVTSIVLGFSSSDRLAVLRESPHYPTLWRTLS